MNWRNIGRTFFFSLISEALLAAGISQFFSRPLEAFFTILAAIWGASIAVTVWRFFRFWLTYWLWSGKELEAMADEFLHQNHIDSVHTRNHIEENNASILDDEFATDKQTKAAVFISGELSVLRSSQPLTGSIAYQAAFNKALRKRPYLKYEHEI